jgi:hypothetical protein
MERGRRAVCASDANGKKGIGTRASRHAGHYVQSGVNVLKLRAIKEGRRAICASNRDEKENIGREISFHAN